MTAVLSRLSRNGNVLRLPYPPLHRKCIVDGKWWRGSHHWNQWNLSRKTAAVAAEIISTIARIPRCFAISSKNFSIFQKKEKAELRQDYSSTTAFSAGKKNLQSSFDPLDEKCGWSFVFEKVQTQTVTGNAIDLFRNVSCTLKMKFFNIWCSSIRRPQFLWYSNPRLITY